MIRLLYFAWLRERIGSGQEQRPLPDGVSQVRHLVAYLQGLGPAYAAAFAEPEALRCAVNQIMAGSETPIADGDEVAFFPPITGG